MTPGERLRKFDHELPVELYPYNPEAKVREMIREVVVNVDRYERALVEIEHHSTDKNAAATARAALAGSNQ